MNLISSAAGRRVVRLGVLILGAAMLIYGAQRGRPPRCCPRQSESVWSVWALDKKKKNSKTPPVSGFLARFRGIGQACAALLTNPHLPNLLKGQIYRERARPSACRGSTATPALPQQARAPSGRCSR